MIAIIFEVWPKAERKQEYLDIAAELRPLLEKIDGFVSIERFESLYEPGKILSLSFFRDEAAVQAWRRTQEHRRSCIQDTRLGLGWRQSDSRGEDSPGTAESGAIGWRLGATPEP